MNPLDAAYTYEHDTCEYLRNKWDATKATPGTVVMIIMLHSINRNKGDGPEAMTSALFARMAEDLHEQRFQAINTQQLAGFLERNARIPYRSAVLIQDGRRYPENFEAHFREFWDKWAGQSSMRGITRGRPQIRYGRAMRALGGGNCRLPDVWPDLRFAFGTAFRRLPGRSLAEAHGYPSGTPGRGPDRRSVAKCFNEQAVRIAREQGYRLGFTFNPRGPVMYNWIPLSNKTDQLRPSYQPEASIGDPLMTLPRFWPHQVHDALDQARIAGEQAAEYAAQNRQVELQYYEIACAAMYGPLQTQ